MSSEIDVVPKQESNESPNISGIAFLLYVLIGPAVGWATIVLGSIFFGDQPLDGKLPSDMFLLHGLALSYFLGVPCAFIAWCISLPLFRATRISINSALGRIGAGLFLGAMSGYLSAVVQILMFGGITSLSRLLTFWYVASMAAGSTCGFLTACIYENLKLKRENHLGRKKHR